MRVRLQYGQVEEALARLHRVSDAGRAAFRARLRHLKQLEFPPGTNTGKGQRAEYTFENYLQMVFALELAQAGFAPRRIVYLIIGNWQALERVFLLALTPDEALANWEGAPSGDLAMVLHPQALQNVTDPNADTFERVHWLSVDELPEMLRHQSSEVQGDPWRSLVILVRPLAEEALNSLRTVVPTIPMISFWEDLRDGQAQRIEGANEAIQKFGSFYDFDPQT